MTDPNAPAFPVPDGVNGGLTKREFIAAQIMSRPGMDADVATLAADELIAELNKKPEEQD